MVFCQVNLLDYVPPQCLPVLGSQGLVDSSKIIRENGLKLWRRGSRLRERNDIDFPQLPLQTLIFFFIVVISDSAFLVHEVDPVYFLPDFLRRFLRNSLFNFLPGHSST